jgi:lysyl-tRNA synthetase, class II
MLRQVDEQLAIKMPEQHAGWMQRRTFRLDLPFKRVTMLGVLEHRLREQTDATAAQEPDAGLAAYRAIGLSAEVLSGVQPLAEVFRRGSAPDSALDSGVRKQMATCENHGERVFLLYELLVEPQLPRLFAEGGRSVPVFVIDHPIEVSPLARRQTRVGGNPDLVDRFELFVHGRELCNAFSELNDPEDQAERFRVQVAKKARGAQETMDYDEDYIRALEHGLPPTAGFGMGIDRLTMMLTAQESIREVILFPLLKPER